MQAGAFHHRNDGCRTRRWIAAFQTGIGLCSFAVVYSAALTVPPPAGRPPVESTQAERGAPGGPVTNEAGGALRLAPGLRVERVAHESTLRKATPPPGGAGFHAAFEREWFVTPAGLFTSRDDARLSPNPVPQQVVWFDVASNPAERGRLPVAFGPDGRVYFAVPPHAGRVRGRADSVMSLESGAVVRCRTDGSSLEIVATGLSDVRGLAFDERGNLFAVNVPAANRRGAELVYIMEGFDFGPRSAKPIVEPEVLDAHPAENHGADEFDKSAAYAFPPVGELHGVPVSLAYSQGIALSPHFRSSFLVAYSGSNAANSGIRAYKLQAHGAGFAVSGFTDLAQGGRATTLYFGTDCRLYLSQARAPDSVPGEVYAIDAEAPSAADREGREQTQRALASGISELPLEKLLGLLGSPEQRVRLASQFALVDRGAAGLDYLQSVAADPAASRPARIHALWTAGVLAEWIPRALNHLPGLLQDGDSEIRGQAARLVGDAARFEFHRFLVPALRDPEVRVVAFAAQSLGKLKRVEAIPALLEVLRRSEDTDPTLRQAVVLALARFGPEALLGTHRDPSRAVRLASLLALRQMGDPGVALYLGDFDPMVVREAAFAIHDTPIPAARPALAALLEQLPLDDVPLVERALHAHGSLGTPENARALATFATRPFVPAALRAQALNRLADWADSPSRDRVPGPPRDAVPRDAGAAREALLGFLAATGGRVPGVVQVAAIRAVAALRVPGTGHALWDVVFQAAHPVEARVAALQALEQLQDPRLEVAAQHASVAREPALRAAAFPIIGRFDPAVALPILGRVIKAGTVADQRMAYQLVGAIEDRRGDEILVDAVARLGRGELSVAVEAELIDAVRRHGSSPAAVLLAQIEARWRRSTDDLRLFQSALTGGDADKGRSLFERHPALACRQCHGPEAPVTRKTLAGSDPSADREERRRVVLALLVGPTSPTQGGAEVEEGSPKDGAGMSRADRGVRSGDFRCPRSKRLGEALSRTELRDLVTFLSESLQSFHVSHQGGAAAESRP